MVRYTMEYIAPMGLPRVWTDLLDDTTRYRS